MPAPRPSPDDSSNSSDSRNGRHTNDSSSDEDRYGPPPSSKLTSSPPTPQREAWTVRGQMLLNFHHAISRAINSTEMAQKCSQIAENMAWSEQGITPQPDDGVGRQRLTPSSQQSKAEEYRAEAALIVDNKTKRDAVVRNKSLALGLLSFVTLRSGRGLSSWIKKAIAKRRVGSGSYQFEKVPAWSANHLKSTTSAKTANRESISIQLKQPSKLRRFLQLALDATVSTSIAFLSGAFLFVPRPSAYIEDMSKLPMVEGKSVYAEMVCPPLLKEYRHVLEQYGGRWPVPGAAASDAEASKLTQEDVSLNVIRAFVENCSKRSKYERALLEERRALNLDHNQASSTVSRFMTGIARRKFDNSASIGDKALSCEADKLGTISVPSPGVPKNIPVNLDQDIFSLDVGGNKGDDENGANSKI